MKKGKNLVYVLTRSVDYEGTDVLGIYKDAEKAFIQQAKHIVEERKDVHNCDSSEVEEFDYLVTRPIGRKFWTKKIDDVSYVVTEHEVLQ